MSALLIEPNTVQAKKGRAREINLLAHSQLVSFRSEGYLIVENVFDESDLSPIIEEFQATVERVARRLYRHGRLSSLYETEPFTDRLAKLAAECAEAINPFEDRALNKSEPLFQFMKHPKILDRVESLVGSEILCHPSYNLHPRLPGGQTVAHQDAGYYLPDVDETLLVVCIIPLVDTTPENGCLWVAPRRHQEGVFKHLRHDAGRQTWLEIPLEILPLTERLVLPLKKGSMVMFSGMMPHGSLVNRTTMVRWSMDLRYQSTTQPTGRWYAPGFVARIRLNPETEAPDCKTWAADAERVAYASARQPERPRYRWPDVTRGASNVIYPTGSDKQ